MISKLGFGLEGEMVGVAGVDQMDDDGGVCSAVGQFRVTPNKLMRLFLSPQFEKKHIMVYQIKVRIIINS